MGKINKVNGVMRNLLWLTREEWQEMDHKLVRIVFGAVGFIVMALFWFYFLRNLSPFGF